MTAGCAIAPPLATSLCYAKSPSTSSPLIAAVKPAFAVGVKRPPGTTTTWGPSQSWGSGGHRHWRVWVVGRQEFLPETGAERAVVEGAADLEQQIGPAPGPAHLLRLS